MKLDKKFSWLEKSFFYESLNLEEQEVCEEIKMRLCSKYSLEIDEYLEAINFWEVYYIPHEFFILFFKIRPLEKVKDLFERTNSELYKFFIIILELEKCVLEKNLCKLAAQKGYLDLLVYAHEHAHENGLEFSLRYACATAALEGHLECLMYLHKSEIGGEPYNYGEIFDYAAIGCHLNCLKFIYKNGYSINNDILEKVVKNIECLKYFYKKGFKWTEYVCREIVKYGNLKCLIYARENGCHWKTVTNSFNVKNIFPQTEYKIEQTEILLAVKNNRLDILIYLYENNCPKDELALTYAAMNGHLEILEYLHKKGCPWDEDACKYAAVNGHLECLKYLHENGCEWDQTTTAFAARNGQYKCLKYAIENGCEGNINKNYFYEKFPNFLYSNEDWISKNSKKKNPEFLKCLKYYYQTGIEFHEYEAYFAAKRGDIKSLIFLREKGIIFDEYVCYSASIMDQLECLTFLHEIGVYYDYNKLLKYSKTQKIIEYVKNKMKKSDCNIS